MRIVKVGVLAPTNKGIPLGVQGENRATEVEFDTRPWFREYPSGTVSAVARRDGDPAPYPLTLDVEEGTAVWQVSDTDTAKAGEGAVELTMTSAGARVRSLTFKTLVTASLTDAPVDDDAWYGWLDKAVVKVDETVQEAQRKMAEVDEEWTGLKADVTAKVEECGKVAAQAAEDAHHAKVDAQAVAKELESAEGSVAKAESAANRAVNAALAADDSAVEASRSAFSAGDSAEAARLSADAAANSADNAATSASNAADAASAASGSASAAAQSATDASNAKVAAQTAKAEAEAAKSEAATSASNAATSATAAAKSASDAAASVNAVNVIAPKTVTNKAEVRNPDGLAIGSGAYVTKDGVAVGFGATSDQWESVAIGYNSSATAYGSIAIGKNASVTENNSVAIGNESTALSGREFSVGNASFTRKITNVTEPVSSTDASTKKYTDDNDTKTLREAKKYTDDNDVKTLTESKKYTDANTSNALVGKVSGNLLHVEDAWPSPTREFVVYGKSVQNGTPTPDAPVPIESIGELSVFTAGKNLIDYQSWKEYVQNKGITRGTCDFDDDWTFTITATEGDAYTPYDEKPFPNIEVVNGQAYTLSWSANNNKPGQIYVFFNGVSGNYVFADNSMSKRLTFTTPSDCSFITFRFGVLNSGDAIKYSNIQIELGSTETDYYPYVGATTSNLLVSEDGTAYELRSLPDGTMDELIINDGRRLLVKRVLKYQADGSEKVYYNATAKECSFSIDRVDGGVKYWNIRCDKLPTVSTTLNNIGCAVNKSTIYFMVPGVITDSVSAKSWLAENKPTFILKLATPETIDLGPADQIALPEPISNVWVDAELTTDMSMTYKRDINIAFENLAQAVVAAAAGE